jgi:hypothetical protein
MPRSLGFPTKVLYALLATPMRATCPDHPSFNYHHNIWWRIQIYILSNSSRGSIPGVGGEGNLLSSPPRPERLWDPPSLLSSGWRAISPGVKRPGREAHRSPPSSAEVNSRSYTSTPHTSSWRGA